MVLPPEATEATTSGRSARAGRDQFEYVHSRGPEPFKGASYKPTWKPDWRFPPGVSQLKVLGLVVGVCLASAVPVWGLPWWRGGLTPEEETKRDSSMQAKQRKREERMLYMQSDDMPRK